MVKIIEAEKEKLFHSPYEYLWLLFPFTLFFNFIAFFWIGIYARRRMWTLFGVLYLALMVLLAIGAEINWNEDLRGEDMSPLSFSLVGLGILGIIACPIHAILTVKPFLERCRDLESEDRVKAKPRSELQWESIRSSKKASDPGMKTEKDTLPIDINTCTAQDFRTLPGFDDARADEAVSIRSERGAFASVDDFLDSLKIEPHLVRRIEELVTVSETLPVLEYGSKRRRVDI